MKKIIALLLVAIMAISLVACDLGNTDNPGKTNDSSQTQTDNTDDYNQNSQTNTGNNQSSSDDQLTLQQFSTDTYSPILKKYTGIEISNEDGVRSRKAKSINRVNELSIEFFCDSIEPAELLKKVVEQCLVLSPEGIWLKTTDPETYKLSKGDNFKDYDSFIATQQIYGASIIAEWMYDYEGSTYVVSSGAMSGEFSMDMQWITK